MPHAGADINETDRDWFPLMMAVATNNEEVVSLLLRNGAEVDKVVQRIEGLRGESRCLDSVRTASKSKKKPPTTSSPGDDAH